MWRQISGQNNAAIHCPTCPKTDVFGLVLGSYEFEFSVTNEIGTTRDSMKIFVVAEPLLVRLLSFRAKAFEFYNQIEWEAEPGPDEFELLRNGIVIHKGRYRTIFKDYSFEGISRYQLRQTDENGKVALSEIIVIANRPKQNKLIAAGDVFTIVSQFKTKAVIAVYTTGGACVAMQEAVLQAGHNRLTSPLATMPKGLYIVKVFSNDINIVQRVWTN
jgi:hypothetical protein